MLQTSSASCSLNGPAGCIALHHLDALVTPETSEKIFDGRHQMDRGAVNHVSEIQFIPSRREHVSTANYLMSRPPLKFGPIAEEQGGKSVIRVSPLV